jgi:hypothetical protein
MPWQKLVFWLSMESPGDSMMAAILLRRAARGKPFEALIQGRSGNADDISHDLTLTTETTIRRLPFQADAFSQRLWCQVFAAFDHLHDTLGANAEAVTVEFLPDALINFDTVKLRHLPEIRVLSAIHFPALV